MRLLASERITTRLNVNIGANSNALGDAGEVYLEAPVVELLRGTRVASAASSGGNAGQIRILAEDRLELSGTNNPSDPERDRGTRITASSAFTAAGNAGSIDIRTGTLIVEDGARISSSTSGVGDGGFIRIEASEGVQISGARGDGSSSSIRAATEVEEAEAPSSLADRTGRAGEILIITPSLDMGPGTEVRSTTALPGAGGRIQLDIGEITLDGALIKAGSVGAGSGDAGDVLIGIRESGESIQYPLTSLILDNASIETSADDAGGGDITIRGLGSIRLSNSGIDASDTASDGGNVDIDATSDILVLEESRLLARAAIPGGDGGVIRITTNAFIQSPDSLVIAENEVIVNSPETNLEAAVTELPEDFQDTPSLFSPLCASRSGADETGRFVVDASPNMPIDPTEALIIALAPSTIELDGIRQQLLDGDFIGSLRGLDVLPASSTAIVYRAVALTALDERGEVDGTFAAAEIIAGGDSLQVSEVRLNQAVAMLLEGEQSRATALLSTVSDAGGAGRYRAVLLARSTEDPAVSLEHADRAAAMLEQRSERPDQRARLHLARTYLDRSRQLAGPEPLLMAVALLEEVRRWATGVRDNRMLALSYGLLGEAYALDGHVAQAQTLIRTAVETDPAATDQLYRWQVQLGYLASLGGNQPEAVDAHRRAVAQFELARPMARARYGADELAFRAVYTDLVSALLLSSEGRPENLAEAQATIERFKHSELQNYFRDECYAALQSTAVTLDQIGERTAIVYPILLPDRLELLVSLEGELRRYVVPGARESWLAEILSLRQTLENRTTNEYLPIAQALYTRLLSPFEADLEAARVTTLVFVPDGPFHTIPFAALHDGERFLGEKYAIAVTPGLSLVAPAPLDAQQGSALLVGVSESIAGFDALPSVPAELSSIQGLVGGELLLNDQFQTGAFREYFVAQQPAIVHVASHAVFDGSAERSFVVAHDGKFSIDDLHRLVAESQFREPLELLTLSACETAAGDSDAALGLSGSAVRAGARSAVGTLWSVSDEATRELIVDFYAGIAEQDVSKAEALQAAQANMRADARFAHPYYWAPFLMISNWL